MNDDIERPDDWEANMNMREFVLEALEAKGMKCTGEAGCGPDHSHLIMELEGLEFRIVIYPLSEAICVCGHTMSDHIEGFDPCSLCDCQKFQDVTADAQPQEPQ